MACLLSRCNKWSSRCRRRPFAAVATVVVIVNFQAIFFCETAGIILRSAMGSIIVNIEIIAEPILTEMKDVLVSNLIFIFFHRKVIGMFMPALLLRGR